MSLVLLLVTPATVSNPPVLVGTVPNYSFPQNTGSYVRAIGDYFTGATSYAISPAVEAGWNFNTTSGALTMDTDATATFGPYTVTATNADGSTPSNTFTVSVTVPVAPVGGGIPFPMWRNKLKKGRR